MRLPRPTPESRLRADSIGVRDGSEALCGLHPGGVGELSPLEMGVKNEKVVLTDVHLLIYSSLII
jgi:hypothetical protein